MQCATSPKRVRSYKPTRLGERLVECPDVSASTLKANGGNLQVEHAESQGTTLGEQSSKNRPVPATRSQQGSFRWHDLPNECQRAFWRQALHRASIGHDPPEFAHAKHRHNKRS
jgi:hypothetical protein